MDLTDTDLPDDIDALKALVRAHAASAHANAQRVVELQDQLSSRVIEIEHLKLTIAKLRRMQFGRKSEKVERQIEQLELRLEDLQADEGAAAQADSKKAQQRRERAPVANRCPITSNAKSVCIGPSRKTARNAVAHSNRWAKTYPSNLNTCARTSASSVIA